MSKEGLLTQCETCGKWKEDDKPLCYDCWLKSKNIKTNIKTAIKDKPQIKYTQQNFREKFKEGLKVRTKHGLLVRSRIERTIAEFLTDNGIIVQYEHWGSDEPEYKEVRRKKEEVYKKYNVKYISTEESDVDNIYDKLKIELSRYGINKTEWR